LRQRGRERMASPWVAGVKIAERKLKMVRDKSRRVEKLLKDSSSMGSGGQGRRKEKYRIRGRLGSKKGTATVPWQWCQKACWVF
jgi:hypothetical protein